MHYITLHYITKTNWLIMLTEMTDVYLLTTLIYCLGKIQMACCSTARWQAGTLVNVSENCSAMITCVHCVHCVHFCPLCPLCPLYYCHTRLQTQRHVRTSVCSALPRWLLVSARVWPRVAQSTVVLQVPAQGVAN